MTRPPYELTPEQRTETVRHLREIGGVYDYVAEFVAHDNTTPQNPERIQP